jgi:translation elongation factor EF-4
MRYEPLAHFNAAAVIELTDVFVLQVSRALSACEGALLLVDAAQGIQANNTSAS